MFVIAWAALGWLVGLALERVAEAVAAATAPSCPGCGTREPGPRGSALLRLLGPAGPSCRGCGSWAICWLATLGPGLAVIFGLLALRWPPGPGLLVVSLYGAILALIAVQDLRRRLVYPIVAYPATVLAIAIGPLVLQLPLWAGLVGALLGAGVFLLFHLLAVLIYRSDGALGFGDVMIAGLVGAMVGFPAVAYALALGALLGGLGAVLVGLVQRSRRAAFAYGPALCLGGLLALLRAGIA